MSGNLGIIIELIVGGLMAVTIGYCVMLERRLRAVRQDETIMRKTVSELFAATERAERAVDCLRQTLGECDRTLADRLKAAERYAIDLEEQIRSGDDVLNRITRIVSTALDSPAIEGAADPAAAFSAHLMSKQPSLRTTSRISQTLAAAQALATQAQSRADLTKRDNVA